ncbi:MAG: hypothetical protein LC130_33495 [Bryobacterales bacterium]|jgi:hypothetical protein|nr:hypothetical protein [Chloroflexota bacterium]MCZ2079910.1 hypothetical protein [Bryobacterales bacterium]NOG75291.1 hypothetical protein [Chloroflexota bacterium]GIK44007.1 MAG: hypothetical protein BroJett011_78400 [Chloroflexota bacterium]
MKDLDWKNLLYVLVTVVVGGAAWTEDSRMVIIVAASIAIVWIVRWTSRAFGWNWQPGKRGLTALLFVVSVVLSLLFNPVAAPAFPPLGQDFSVWLPAFVAYVGALVAVAAPVVSGATLIYNILLAKVLEKLADGLTARVKPAA